MAHPFHRTIPLLLFFILLSSSLKADEIEPNAYAYPLTSAIELKVFHSQKSQIRQLEEWKDALKKIGPGNFTSDVHFTILRDMVYFLRSRLHESRDWKSLSRHFFRQKELIDKISSSSPLSEEQNAFLKYLQAGLLADQLWFGIPAGGDPGSGVSDGSVSRIRSLYGEAIEKTQDTEVQARILEEAGRVFLNFYEKFHSLSSLESGIGSLKKIPQTLFSEDLRFLVSKALYHLSWYGHVSEKKIERAEEALLWVAPLLTDAEISDEKTKIEMFHRELLIYIEKLREAKTFSLPTEAVFEKKEMSVRGSHEAAPLSSSDIVLKAKVDETTEWYLFIVPKTDYLWKLAPEDPFLRLLPLQEKEKDDLHNARVGQTWSIIRQSNPQIQTWTELLKEGTELKFPLWLKTLILSSLSENIPPQIVGLQSENDLIAGYRRAILAEMARMRQMEPKPFHVVFKLLFLEKLLSRENPSLSLDQLKEIYSLISEKEEETEASLLSLARMIDPQERGEILSGMEKSDLLEYVIDWLGKNDFLTDQEIAFWKKQALILKIQTFAQSGAVHLGRPLTPHEMRVYHFLKSKLQTYPFETSSFEELQALWALCEKPYTSPFPWLEWFGNEAIWSSFEEMNDETLFAFSETLSEYIDTLTFWAVKTGRVKRQDIHRFRRKLMLLKLKNFDLSRFENEIFKHFSSKIISEQITDRSLKSLQNLHDIFSKNPPELPELLEWLGVENVFAIVREMDPELFGKFYKNYPGWIGALERHAETYKESNPEAFDKWQRLRLLAEIWQTNVDVSTIQDVKLKRLMEKLLEKIKSGDLNTESADRLSLLAEILKGGAPAFSKLLEWIGPEKLSEWAQGMDVETLVSLVEILAKLHASGLLDLDLRKFQGILKDIAAGLDGAKFKIPSVWQNFQFKGLWEKWEGKGWGEWNIKGPKIDFNVDLGFDIDNPVSFDFSNVMRRLFGPDLYSIDYDFEDYREEPDPSTISSEIYQAFSNDETLHNEKEDYKDSSYSYSLKAAATLLETYPFENKVVFEKSDYLELEKLETLYKISFVKLKLFFSNSWVLLPTSGYFPNLFYNVTIYFPHLMWLSECDRLHGWFMQENLPLQETETVERLIQAGYLLIDHTLEWLHFRYQHARKEGSGGGVVGIYFTLKELDCLLFYANRLHNSGKVDTLRWSDLGKKWIKVTDEWLGLLYEKKMDRFDESAFYFIFVMNHDDNNLIRILHNSLESQNIPLTEHSFPGVYKEALPENLAYDQSKKYLPHAFPLRAFTPHERRSFFNLEYHPFLKMLSDGGDPEWLMAWMTLEFGERFRALTSPDLLSDQVAIREKAEEERALALELLMTVDQKMLDSLPQQGTPAVETIRILYTRNVIEGFRYWRDHPGRNHSFLRPTYFTMWDETTRDVYIPGWIDATHPYKDLMCHFFLFPGIGYGAKFTEDERKELFEILLWELHRLEAHYAFFGFRRFAKVVIWNTFFDFLIRMISLSSSTAGEISLIIDILLPEALKQGFFTPHEVRRKLLSLLLSRYAKITAIVRNYLKEWHSESLIPAYPIPNETEALEDLKKHLPSIFLAASANEGLAMFLKNEILREFEKIAEGNPEPSFLFRLAFAVKRFQEKNRTDFVHTFRYSFERKPFIQKTLSLFFYYLMILTPENDQERPYAFRDFELENRNDYILKLTPEEESTYATWQKMIEKNKGLIRPNFLPRYPHFLGARELINSETDLDLLRAIEFPWLRLLPKDDPAPQDMFGVMYLPKEHSGRNIQLNDLSIHHKEPENRRLLIPSSTTGTLSLVSQLWLLHNIQTQVETSAPILVIQEANKAQAIAEEVGYAYMPEEGYQPMRSTLQSYRKNLFVLDDNVRQKLEEKMVSAQDIKNVLDAEIKPGSLDYQFDDEYYDARDLPTNGIPIEWGGNAVIAYAPEWFLNQKIKHLDETYPFETLKSLVEGSRGNKADISELLLFHTYQLKRRLIDASRKKEPDVLNEAAFSEQLLFWIETARKELHSENQDTFFHKGLELVATWKTYLHSAPSMEIGLKLGEWFGDLVQKKMLAPEEQKNIFDPFARQMKENEDSLSMGFLIPLLEENESIISGLSDFKEHLSFDAPFLWAKLVHGPHFITPLRKASRNPLSKIQDPMLRQWLEIVFQIEENSKKADSASILRWIENAFNNPETRTEINLIRALSLLQKAPLSRIDAEPSIRIGFHLAEWAMEAGREKDIAALPPSIRRYALARFLEKTRLERSEFGEEKWFHKDFYALARLRWVLSPEEWKSISKKIPITKELLNDFLKAPWEPSWPNVPLTLDEERHKDNWMAALKKQSIERPEFFVPLLLHDILQKLLQWKVSGHRPAPDNETITSSLLKLEGMIDRSSPSFTDPLLIYDVKALVKKYDDFIRNEEVSAYEDKNFSQKLFHLSRIMPSIRRKLNGGQ